MLVPTELEPRDCPSCLPSWPRWDLGEGYLAVHRGEMITVTPDVMGLVTALPDARPGLEEAAEVEVASLPRPVIDEMLADGVTVVITASLERALGVPEYDFAGLYVIQNRQAYVENPAVVLHELGHWHDYGDGYGPRRSESPDWLALSPWEFVGPNPSFRSATEAWAQAFATVARGDPGCVIPDEVESRFFGVLAG